jgi:HlyD family secretion protein
MRRTLIILLVIVVLAAAGYYFWQQRQAQLEAAVEILREAAVERGAIQATVNATGSIEPEALVSLTFGLGGTVQQVNVVRGQVVAAGDVLATLDSGELELTVQQAADALHIQQLMLEQRLNSEASPAALAGAQADIEAAEANVAVAEANLAAAEAAVQQATAQRAQLLAGASAADIAAAEAEIAARTVEVEAVQDQYDRIIEVGLGGVVEEQTRFQLNAARQALTAAQVRLATLQAGPRPADIQAANAAIASAEAQVLAAQGNIAAAQANVARAQAAHDRLLEPPTAEEIAILEAQVTAAETNLALAQLRLDAARITAPMAGTVANVLINAGEQAAPGAPAVTIVNEGAFHLEVSVDEIDIDRIAVGQVVSITLDALPNAAVTGIIAEIAPTALAGAGGGVVTYLVTINIGAPGVELRPGMTANASIVVEEIAEALIVPNWAIRLDRDTGEAFVNRLAAGDVVEEVVIETGLRNEQFSEVLSGLNPGDVVVVTNEREGFSLFGGE